MSNINRTPRVNPDALAPAGWNDPVLASADSDTLRQWQEAQKNMLAMWRMASNATAKNCANARLPASMRGLRQYGQRDGGVLVPMRDMLGNIWALQPLCGFHPDEGNNPRPPSFSHSARVVGLHYWHGPRIEGDGAGKVIAIAEHVHDAVTWKNENRRPCVVAFAPENVGALANALRAIFPAAAVVLWARRQVQEKPMRIVAIATGSHVVFGSDGPDMVQPLAEGKPAAMPEGEPL